MLVVYVQYDNIRCLQTGEDMRLVLIFRSCDDNDAQVHSSLVSTRTTSAVFGSCLTARVLGLGGVASSEACAQGAGFTGVMVFSMLPKQKQNFVSLNFFSFT